MRLDIQPLKKPHEYKLFMFLFLLYGYAAVPSFLSSLSLSFSCLSPPSMLSLKAHQTSSPILSQLLLQTFSPYSAVQSLFPSLQSLFLLAFFTVSLSLFSVFQYLCHFTLSLSLLIFLSSSLSLSISIFFYFSSLLFFTFSFFLIPCLSHLLFHFLADVFISTLWHLQGFHHPRCSNTFRCKPRNIFGRCEEIKPKPKRLPGKKTWLEEKKRFLIARVVFRKMRPFMQQRQQQLKHTNAFIRGAYESSGA